jgi:DNA processing protein
VVLSEFLIDAVFTPGKELDVVLNGIKAGSPVDFPFTGKESDGLFESLKNLPDYAFLAEELVNNHNSVISVMEPDNPRQLKHNLGKNSPVLLYSKGNSDLLKLSSIAITGSRNCSRAALLFADRIAKAGTGKKQVVVSGFAKGMDQQALNSTLAYPGQSIKVLPQGILTCRSNTCYQYIAKGEVLVMSSYHPRTPWNVGLAMDRNIIINDYPYSYTHAANR